MELTLPRPHARYLTILVAQSPGTKSAHQQSDPECGIGVHSRTFQRALHGIEFAFEFLLAVHKITCADAEQLQAPYQAEECLYTHLGEVEQFALDDGDTLGPQSLPLSSMGVYPAHRRAASRISLTPSPKEQS